MSRQVRQRRLGVEGDPIPRLPRQSSGSCSTCRILLHPIFALPSYR
jgi:hypothetical protein